MNLNLLSIIQQLGNITPVVLSKIGYHIFKNLGERKAAGKIKAQQILLAIPPGADDAAKKQLASLADSLYKRIIAGDNFNHLAAAFSNDYVTAASGGTMPDIGVGQYDPAFEKMIMVFTERRRCKQTIPYFLWLAYCKKEFVKNCCYRYK
ncbi:MAG: peptidylprolyl isomerase [Chitinophagaceae bacterium]